jgi:hypothetical protein
MIKIKFGSNFEGKVSNVIISGPFYKKEKWKTTYNITDTTFTLVK